MPTYHNLAKIGKDVAAGAVLVAAVTAVLIGLSLFLHLLLIMPRVKASC